LGLLRERIPFVRRSKDETIQTEDGIITIMTRSRKTKVSFWRSTVKNGLNYTFVTVLTVAILTIFLAPFAFMMLTSLKTQEQITVVGAPIWPAKPPVFEYDGKQVDVFTVPLAKCQGFDPTSSSSKGLALVKKGQKESIFVDPNDPGRGEFACAVSWRSLDRAWSFSPTWNNYQV
jgi:multiple sugar transport system permease protein